MNLMLTTKAFQGGNSCSHFSKSSIWLEKFFFSCGGEKRGRGWTTGVDSPEVCWMELRGRLENHRSQKLFSDSKISELFVINLEITFVVFEIVKIFKQGSWHLGVAQILGFVTCSCCSLRMLSRKNVPIRQKWYHNHLWGCGLVNLYLRGTL